MPQYQLNKFTMDEDTIVDQGKVQEQTGNKELKKNDKDSPKGKRKISTATRITAAAFVGGMASRLFTPMKVFPNASIEGIIDFNNQANEFEPAPETSAHLVGHDMPIASEVNDSLNFNEAFAAARKETGPGGLFVWHGHTYGTYYKNEWDSMSQEEQDQYWADVHHTAQQIHYEESEPESESVSELEIEPDSELVEVELDEESDEMAEVVEEVEEEVALVDSGNEDDIDVSLDEIETDELIEVEDEELVEVSIDDDDEVEVLVDDVDENEEIELAVETDDEILEDPLPIDENEVMETDDEIDLSDDMLDSQDVDYVGENADIDDFASTLLDPKIEIENNMDMSDFL